jgi:hypothetical protein
MKETVPLQSLTSNSALASDVHAHIHSTVLQDEWTDSVEQTTSDETDGRGKPLLPQLKQG